MCESELEAGILCFAKLGLVAARAAGVRKFGGPPEMRLPWRTLTDFTRGLGVTLLSMDDNLLFRSSVPTGFVAVLALTTGTEASETGGEGGSCASVSSAEDSDLASGGVVISGELAVELGDASTFLSNVGEPKTDKSVDMVERCRDSCFFSLSCKSSASILSSESSSRSLCDSMRSFSRSCSPILISSSMMTALSMAWLYLDSMSSRDDVVFRAWRSKSSFATSTSLSFNCKDRFDSRRVVISFSSKFCAALASVLDSLYFLCSTC